MMFTEKKKLLNTDTAIPDDFLPTNDTIDLCNLMDPLR